MSRIIFVPKISRSVAYRGKKYPASEKFARAGLANLNDPKEKTENLYFAVKIMRFFVQNALKLIDGYY